LTGVKYYLHDMKIRELILKAHDPEEQLQFYSRILRLQGGMNENGSCSIAIGASQLHFEKGVYYGPYHFAINIPSCATAAAAEWLSSRVDLLRADAKEIVDFPNWRARSVYFRDAERNILELIASDDIQVKPKNTFDQRSFLNISEVGIGTRNAEADHRWLSNQKKLPVYSGDYSRFCALGDEQGLLLLAHPDRKTWYPTDEPVKESELWVKGDFNFHFTGGTFREIN
jgi:hypothetical protein